MKVKHLRNIFVLIFSIFYICSFSSCSKKNLQSTTNQGAQKIKITATFYPLYIMLLNITDGAPDVELALLAPANTGCLHDYQLTTKDMRAISSSSILVANGAGMEDFLDKALELKKDSLIIASEGFNLVNENPHIWVSLTGASYETQKICDGLCRLNEKNAEIYKANTKSYLERIDELSKKMHSELNQFANSKIVTFHEAFPYFAAEFNFDLSAVLETEEGEEPSAKELYSLVNFVKDTVSKNQKIALFAENSFSQGAAQILSSETGLKLRVLDPCVTGNLEKDAYLKAMEKNLEVLKEALQ